MPQRSVVRVLLVFGALIPFTAIPTYFYFQPQQWERLKTSFSEWNQKPSHLATPSANAGEPGNSLKTKPGDQTESTKEKPEVQNPWSLANFNEKSKTRLRHFAPNFNCSPSKDKTVLSVKHDYKSLVASERHKLVDGSSQDDRTDYVLYEIVRSGQVQKDKQEFNLITIRAKVIIDQESEPEIILNAAKRFLVRDGEAIELTSLEIEPDTDQGYYLILQAYDQAIEWLKNKYHLRDYQRDDTITVNGYEKKGCEITASPLPLRFSRIAFLPLKEEGSDKPTPEGLQNFEEPPYVFYQTEDGIQLLYNFTDGFKVTYKSQVYECFSRPGKREYRSRAERLNLTAPPEMKIKQVDSDNMLKIWIPDLTEKEKADHYEEYKRSWESVSQEHQERSYLTYPMERLLTRKEVDEILPVVFVKDSLNRYFTCESRALDFDTSGWVEPLIYIYSKASQKLRISLSSDVVISSSSPAFINNQLEIETNSSGLIRLSRDHHQYPSLFWEGRGKRFPKVPSKGDVVRQKELAVYFHKRLLQFGLNEREKNEFIQYWIPELSRFEKVLIEFLLNEEVDSYVGLSTSAPMDQRIRVYLLYRPVENEHEVFEIKNYPTIKRATGNVLVEWGGVGEISF